MGGSWDRGTPKNHPFIDGIFHEINHPAMGISPWLWKPLCVWWSVWWSVPVPSKILDSLSASLSCETSGLNRAQVAISTPQIRVSGSTKIKQQRSRWTHHRNAVGCMPQKFNQNYLWTSVWPLLVRLNQTWLGFRCFPFPHFPRNIEQKERGHRIRKQRHAQSRRFSILFREYWTSLNIIEHHWTSYISHVPNISMFIIPDISRFWTYVHIFPMFQISKKSHSKQRSHPAAEVRQLFDFSIAVSIAGFLCRDALLKRRRAWAFWSVQSSVMLIFNSWRKSLGSWMFIPLLGIGLLIQSQSWFVAAGFSLVWSMDPIRVCRYVSHHRDASLSYYISYSDDEMVDGTSATTQSTWGDCSLAVRKSHPEVATSKSV